MDHSHTQMVVVTSSKVKWVKQATVRVADPEPVPPTFAPYKSERGWILVTDFKVVQGGHDFLFPKDQILMVPSPPCAHNVNHVYTPTPPRTHPHPIHTLQPTHAHTHSPRRRSPATRSSPKSTTACSTASRRTRTTWCGTTTSCRLKHGRPRRRRGRHAAGMRNYGGDMRRACGQEEGVGRPAGGNCILISFRTLHDAVSEGPTRHSGEIMRL